MLNLGTVAVAAFENWSCRPLSQEADMEEQDKTVMKRLLSKEV